MLRFFSIYILICGILSSQNINRADKLISVSFGDGSIFGQDSLYFPQNVFSGPDTSARINIGSADPIEIASLGLSGEIILGFNKPVLNKNGYDFTVFENAFLIQFGPRAGEIFAEPAKVSVSADGITYYTFPFDSLTLDGCAGTIPTNGNENPQNPAVSGGNSFDIELLGLSEISFVKLTDISEIVKNNPTHPFYDPIINGFDLDAIIETVAADTISSVNDIKRNKKSNGILVYPNPIKSSSLLNLILPDNKFSYAIEIYNILGERVLYKNNVIGSFSEVFRFSSGIFLIKASAINDVIFQKFRVIK